MYLDNIGLNINFVKMMRGINTGCSCVAFYSVDDPDKYNVRYSLHHNVNGVSMGVSKVELHYPKMERKDYLSYKPERRDGSLIFNECLPISAMNISDESIEVNNNVNYLELKDTIVIDNTILNIFWEWGTPDLKEEEEN